MGRYLRPVSVEEALGALNTGPMTVIAGGTDYYPARVGRSLDDDIVDITAIEGLHGVIEEDTHWRIGAATTWSELAAAALPPLFDGLKRAAREVGGVQIQNAGTIAGNVCNASPAADGIPVLMALDAGVELRSADAVEVTPLDRFVLGNRRTALGPEQLVTAFIVPKPRGAAKGHFLKLGARRYLVISIVMVAAVIETADDGTIAAARVAVGACSPVARRLPGLEARLVGLAADGRLGDAVEPADVAGLDPIDDVRASAEYRMDAALTMVRRTLNELGGGT